MAAIASHSRLTLVLIRTAGETYHHQGPVLRAGIGAAAGCDGVMGRCESVSAQAAPTTVMQISRPRRSQPRPSAHRSDRRGSEGRQRPM